MNMQTEAAQILSSSLTRKRDLKSKMKFDAQSTALMLEHLKLKLAQGTLKPDDDISAIFDALVNLKKAGIR
jgi:hypothetical protein